MNALSMYIKPPVSKEVSSTGAAAAAAVALWTRRTHTMRSTDYARASRALFCSVLLLSQHAVVDANAWVTGRSSRSSTLAVAAPGGRDRPVRDWTAISRDAGKALEDRKASKAEEEVVEAVEEVLPEVHDSAEDVADSLELEEGTPQAIAIMLGKVAVITTVGVIAAKKVVKFAKAFIKARKEPSSGSVEDVSAVATTEGAGDEEEQVDEAAGEVAAEEVAVVVDGDGEEEGGDDEVTDVFATPDEEEEEEEEERENEDSSQRGEASSKATEDVQARAESELENSTNSAGDEEGESDEGGGDGASGVKYSERDGGKGDVSYV